MKAKELHLETDTELRERVAGLEAELFNLRFQRATGQVENSERFRQIRKDIARIKTVLRQREIGETGQI